MMTKWHVHVDWLSRATDGTIQFVNAPVVAQLFGANEDGASFLQRQMMGFVVFVHHENKAGKVF
jgi:hypothetical protein